MQEYYENNKDKIFTTFLLFGESKDGTCFRQSTFCCQSMLEKVKESFGKIHSITVYSLHQNLKTTLHSLLNADWSGKYKEAISPYPERLRIISPLALKAQRMWNKNSPHHIYSTYEIPAFMPQVKRAPLQRKNILIKSDQHTLKDAFAIEAGNNTDFEAMEVDEMMPTTRKRSREEVGFVKKA